MSDIGPSTKNHKIIASSSSVDIVKNYQSVYDTFQANLAELKISKTFLELDLAKNKWAIDKESAGGYLQHIGKGSNTFQKFRAVKQMPLGLAKNESVMDDLESSKSAQDPSRFS